MPLSEEELRLLEQMERALVADDPKLASTMRGTSIRAAARRRALLAAVAFLIGIAVLMTGAVRHMTPIGIVGFVIMLASAYVALSSWRGQSKAIEKPGAARPATGAFRVIDGGRAKRGAKGPRRAPGRPSRGSGQGSMMERFEERWRRRRDQNGF